MRQAYAFSISAFFIMAFPVIAANRAESTMPAAVRLELRHVEETYRVLDVVAEKIWPGWTDYRQVPFLLTFENGLRVLIGHPNPPAGFQLLPDVRCAGRAVAVDQSKLVALELKPPLRVGGGPLPFGQTADGREITVVDMKLTRPSAAKDIEEGEASTTTEDQLLIYIHELFHCFQKEHIKVPLFGNFRFNPDINYALYSELEGLTLLNAYQEPDADKARALLKEFLAVRQLKRSGSMTEQQGNEESSDEFREGSATYAEVRTLEVLKSEDFKPGLTAAEDPEYHGFSNASAILLRYPKRLKKDSELSNDNYSKAYTYGSFQALLCQRLFPGWQESLVGETHFLMREISKRLSLLPEERAGIEQRILMAYPVEQIRERHAKLLGARDAAYQQVKARTGRIYILDFKRTDQYVNSLIKAKDSYTIGLIRMHLNGLPLIKFDDVELSAVTVPAEVDQLYYIRLVDTNWKERAEAFTISGEKQTDGTWKDAQVRTPLFTLTAPHIGLKETGNRVKVQVLSRTK